MLEEQSLNNPKILDLIFTFEDGKGQQLRGIWSEFSNKNLYLLQKDVQKGFQSLNLPEIWFFHQKQWNKIDNALTETYHLGAFFQSKDEIMFKWY
jgi:hypothetical protein